jgi:hypothetical protein
MIGQPVSMTNRRFMTVVLGMALLCCCVMVAVDWQQIVRMDFRDTDDALRYVEVHAFLNGQNWFDVSQHRINPPVGGPMHWSRLVDLPIAGLMLLFQPIAGAALADRIAMTLVPLGLIVAMFAMFSLAARRIAGDRVALVGTGLLGISLSILIQFHPMRIDHHDWQIVMSAIALWATFDARPRRSGAIAGIAVALWLHISAEAMPYAILFAGLFALQTIRRAADWPRLRGYMLALVIASTVLLIGVRGWQTATIFWCDSMSPTYLLPMTASTLALMIAMHQIGEHSGPRRFLTVAIAGVAGGLVALFTARSCLAGPFAGLDPIVYREWYVHVLEGRPIWEQTGVIASVVAAPVLPGIVGTVLAMRSAPDPARRLVWYYLLLLQLGTTAVAIMVMRAMSVAHLFLLPGNAWLLLALWSWAMGLTRSLARILSALALFLLTPLGIETASLIILSGTKPDHTSSEAVRAQCTSQDMLRGLAAIPRGKIFAPLDVSPFLLAFTPHSVMATGHHRNNWAMKQVIQGFTEEGNQARMTILHSKADYFAFCPGGGELSRYIAERPASLISNLMHGRVPEWLRPIPMRPGESIQVYRVLYPAGTKRIATPFIQ